VTPRAHRTTGDAFLVFVVLFEAVIGIGGRRYGLAARYALAGVLIVAGLALLSRSLWRLR